MIRELLLIHHSHTDIGYTHPQPAVFELHLRFIEEALDLADATCDEPDEARFRWTCEVTGTTRMWWDQASNSERDRFVAAVKRRQFEVAALQWHLTPLADLPLLINSLKNVAFFRAQGIPVSSAMNTDVNGVPWGMVDLLLDHQIEGFSMSSNSHMGAPVLPRPGAFRWGSPSGRELVVWNGYQYWHVANGLMRIPSSVDVVAAALPALLAETKRRGFSLPYLPLQITNPHHPDNAGPDPTLTPFIKSWNASEPSVRMRTVLLSDVFDRLRRETLPILSGDWTDYWNFGAGSSARETTVLKEGLRVLSVAEEASAWPGVTLPRELHQVDEAFVHLSLYAEHTWGADCSISQPESNEARMQWAVKSAYAYQGLGYARIAQRDALHRLAKTAGGEDPTLLLYNPLPVPSRVQVKLPAEDLNWALTPGEPHRQRLDGALANMDEGSSKWCLVNVPPLGYRTYPIHSLPKASSTGLEASEDSLTSSRVAMSFLPDGGVGSFLLDGAECVSSDSGFTFGLPILERPRGGSRREIMKLDFTQLEPADGWQRDWPRVVNPGGLLASSSRAVEGAVEFSQTFRMANGDKLETIYRLFADDPSLELEAVLQSAGDAGPYSLALPFTLIGGEPTTWHFDTAGALVEFDREQLPNASRHYVTARHFVRMQTDRAALSIATPDLPLWKFGGMFFAPTSELSPLDRRPVMLGWLANNYWEVNFLANQTGRTRYRFRILPHAPEAINESYLRVLPYSTPPSLHAYRGLGPVTASTQTLLGISGAGVALERVVRDGSDTVLIFQNLKSSTNGIVLSEGTLKWESAWLARLDGVPLKPLDGDRTLGWSLEISSRGLCAVRLSPLAKASG